MSARLRLVQLVHLPDVGRVRVAWSATWGEYQVKATAAGGQLVGEYFTDDRADAMGTAELMLAQLADAAGMPA
jgi:hypothetical protein